MEDDDVTDAAKIRTTIRSLRKAKGLRAQDVARKLGLSRSYYSQLESGARRLTVGHLIEIARILGVSVNELVGNPREIGEREYKHVIPVNDSRVYRVLASLLREEPEDIEDWQILLREAKERLAKLKKEKTSRPRVRKAG